MSPDFERLIAEHQRDAEHDDYAQVWSGCTCGDEHPYDAHSAHLAAVLRAEVAGARAAAETDLERVLELVRQLDADVAATAPAQYSIGLMRGRLKTILQTVGSNRSEP